MDLDRARPAGVVNVNLCRSGFDTTLARLRGDSVSGLTEIASNDDIDPTEDDDDGETTTPLNCPANRTASGSSSPPSPAPPTASPWQGSRAPPASIDGRIGAGGLGTLPPNPGRCSNRALGSGGRDDLSGTAFGDIIGGLSG